jgi:hypothetical protein
MNIDFNLYIEFKKKHPDIERFYSLDFVFFNLVISDSPEECILDILNTIDYDQKTWSLYLEEIGLWKLIGPSYRDISLRELGKELIGHSKTDELLELAKTIRDIFPKGIRSGGYLVRSSEVDIANKLKSFKKKHKFTNEQIIEAAKRYVNRKKNEGYNYMQLATYFIEKNGMSTLASECSNDSSEPISEVMSINTML